MPEALAVHPLILTDTVEQDRRPPECVAQAGETQPRVGPAPVTADSTWPRPTECLRTRDASALDSSTREGLSVTRIIPNKPAVCSSAQRSPSAAPVAQLSPGLAS
jgi:hypothetical protein